MGNAELVSILAAGAAMGGYQGYPDRVSGYTLPKPAGVKARKQKRKAQKQARKQNRG